MILREICQICGESRIIDTEEPVKLSRKTPWKNYKLHDFGIEFPYQDYEINVCGGCLDEVPSEVESYYISNTEKAHDVHYDWDVIEKLVLKSLGYDSSSTTIKEKD